MVRHTTDMASQAAGGRPEDSRSRYWSVLSCPRCAGLQILETNSTGKTPPRMIHVIPSSTEDVDVEHLPDDVRSYYRHAIRVLDAGVPDAAAVQLRRALEAAAAHHAIRTGSLINRIRGLIKAGLVTTQFGQVLDHVRIIGNIGAHASDERLDEERVRRALRFTTQVLRNLFEIPAQLEVIQRESSAPSDELPDQAAGDD